MMFTIIERKRTKRIYMKCIKFYNNYNLFIKDKDNIGLYCIGGIDNLKFNGFIEKRIVNKILKNINLIENNINYMKENNLNEFGFYLKK